MDYIQILEHLNQVVPTVDITDLSFNLIQLILMGVLFVLIAIDLDSGVKSAKAQGKVIESGKYRRTGTKIWEYAQLLFVVNIVGVLTPSPSTFSNPLVIGLAVIFKSFGFLGYAYLYKVEIMSIIENSKVFGGFYKFIMPFVKSDVKALEEKDDK